MEYVLRSISDHGRLPVKPKGQVRDVVRHPRRRRWQLFGFDLFRTQTVSRSQGELPPGHLASAPERVAQRRLLFLRAVREIGQALKAEVRAPCVPVRRRRVLESLSNRLCPAEPLAADHAASRSVES